jgi:hypothetical protein
MGLVRWVIGSNRPIMWRFLKRYELVFVIQSTNGMHG